MRVGVLLLFLAACGRENAAHDSHNHAPRYGGQLVELGAHEFQVELLLDPETGILAAYLWDGHVERPVPSAMPSMTIRAKVGTEVFSIELKPVANPYSSEGTGKATNFKGQSDRLKRAARFDGALVAVSIAGKTFAEQPFQYRTEGAHGQ